MTLQTSMTLHTSTPDEMRNEYNLCEYHAVVNVDEYYNVVNAVNVDHINQDQDDYMHFNLYNSLPTKCVDGSCPILHFQSPYKSSSNSFIKLHYI